MKRHLLATTAFTLIGLTMSSPGFAKPRHPAPPSPPPVQVYDWTGFYLGLNGGGAWGQSQVTTNAACNTPPGTGYICDSAGTGAANAAVLNAAGSGNIHSSAFTGGIQAGYNYQWRQDGVVGFETDFDSFHLGGTRMGAGVYPVNGPGGPAAPPSGYGVRDLQCEQHGLALDIPWPNRLARAAESAGLCDRRWSRDPALHVHEL
jgi:outer membrane immunogenic protein